MNPNVRKIYVGITRNLTKISPTLATKLVFYVACKKRLNLKNPKSFNEKIQWLKLNDYYNNPLITQCADKYAVREYIKAKGCEEILNDLIGVYDSASEIDWEALPQKFVLKCNHGCGYNIICVAKDSLVKEDVINKLDRWMRHDFYLNNAELNYQFIEKKIICERYLESEDGISPNDYKIFCFNGKPQLVLGCSGRGTNLKRGFYNTNWEPVEVSTARETIRKPLALEKMLEYSRILCEDFKFVRVDFYEIGGKIYFGELTFTPEAGIASHYTEYGLKYMGELLQI